MKRWMTHLGITLFTLGLALLPMNKGEFFGSEGDWISQHVGAAENIRQMMLSTRSIFPQYSVAGGGCNIYDYAYYGLYRPEVLISCLYPDIEMKFFIAGYALLCMVLSVNLCYIWLSKKRLSKTYTLLASLLFASASCFFHAHHQIVFVNYLPFLVIALLGIDRFLTKGRSGLMIFGLTMVCFHSFYYAPCCFVVCLLYGLDQIQNTGNLLWKGTMVRAAGNALLSLGISGVLLLPTLINILSTQKDAGRFMEDGLPILDPALQGMLFTPYGCGLTFISLVGLLLALRRKAHRCLAGVILLIVAVPAVSWILNGFLYARGKILIPLLPLIIWLCADTLSWIEEKLRNRNVSKGWLKRATPFLLVVPVLTSLVVNQGENYISADDQRQTRFTADELCQVVTEKDYRFDWLSNGFVNSNLLFSGEIYKTAMYSSINNALYHQFYYDTMNNPIALRNRVVMIPSQNPFFNYIMGIRYIQCHAKQLPADYDVLMQKGQYVIAENTAVLPIAYGTDQILSVDAYDGLDFPANAESLCRYAVIEGQGDSSFDSKITQLNEQDLFTGHLRPGNGKLELKKNLDGKILIITFEITDLDGKGVDIIIEGVKNHLSAKNAPYPNHNLTFTYVLMPDDGDQALDFTASERNWKIENMQTYVMDKDELGMKKYYPAEITGKNDANTMFTGEVNMEEDGCFVTSFPYRSGYRVYIDGKPYPYELVNTAFVGFPLAKGIHQIRIDYEAPGFAAGIVLSFGSLLICFYMICWERKEKNEGRLKTSDQIYDDRRNDHSC